MASRKIDLPGLLRPHWKGLVVALLAVVGITVADVLQPWPLKIVLDYVLAGRRMPDWLTSVLNFAFAGNKNAVLKFAVAAVAIITVVDSISSYVETYMMTSI